MRPAAELMAELAADSRQLRRCLFSPMMSRFTPPCMSADADDRGYYYDYSADDSAERQRR